MTFDHHKVFPVFFSVAGTDTKKKVSFGVTDKFYGVMKVPSYLYIRSLTGCVWIFLV